MRCITFVLMLLVPAYQSFAQAKKEPVIGFALSGGGAKGLAHIGALKALEEAGIYPDVITGTSMGSIVGGLYAAGYTPEQLIELSSQLTWDDYFNDMLDRTYLTIEEKTQSDRYQIQFPIVKGKIQLPTGLVKGEKIGLLLSRLTIPVHGKRDFDNFSPKYRAVATDLETGEAVVLADGHLSDAIRASMSIPTVFQPIELDGRLLVDGLLIRNLPVQEAYDLGADIVIAIDVGGALYNKDEVSSVFKVLEQTSSFLGEISNEQQRSLASVVISPDMSDYSALTFENIDTLIQRGVTAVEEKLPEMEYLLKGYQRKKARPNFEKNTEIFRDSFLIQGVDYDVASKESEELLRSLFNLRVPNVISLNKLEKKLKTVYSSRFFKNLDYRLLPAEEEGYILSLRAEEQSGNFLKLSANYDSDYGGGILMNATFRNQLIRRSKLSLDVRVSEKPSILGEYLIYTPTRPNFGIRLTGKFNLFYGEFYNDSELINEFGWRHGLAEASIFTAITSRLSFSAGYGMDVLSQNNKFYDPSSDEIQLKQQYGFFAINRDTRDRVHFPTKGSLVALHVKGIVGGTLKQNNIIEEKSDLDFSYRLQLQAGHSFKIHPKFILQWNNYFGYQDYKDNTNVINLFYIGRDLPYERHHVPFYGLRYMERSADKFAISELAFQLEPFPNRFVVAHFNYGYIHAPRYEYFNGERVTVEATEDFMGGVAIDIGLLTPIGPGWFSSQYNIDEKRFNFLLHLGYIF